MNISKPIKTLIFMVVTFFAFPLLAVVAVRFVYWLSGASYDPNDALMTGATGIAFGVMAALGVGIFRHAP